MAQKGPIDFLSSKRILDAHNTLTRQFTDNLFSCCIIIPVYKEGEALTLNERSSLKQALTVLNRRKIFLIVPENLNIDTLIVECRDLHSNVDVCTFSSCYFTADRSGYSQLLTSEIFYSRFKEFDYMLVYQIDAWIFKDDLDAWMALGFSYIGAPLVYEEFHSKDDFEKIAIVGNGGFSLRHISTHLRVIQRNIIIRKFPVLLRYYWKNNRLSPIRFVLRIPLLILMLFGIRNRYKYLVENYNIHEDYVWCEYVAAACSWYTLPTPILAARFAFDQFPKVIFEKINAHQLPVGCHGWAKNDPDFWENSIKPFA